MDYSHNYLGKIVAITTGSKDVNEGNINGIFPFFTCSRNHTFSNSYSFDDEALLISGNGDVGNVKYYKGKFEAYQRTYVLTNSILDFKYLYYYLENGLVKFLSSEQSGTTIQFIKLGQLKNFPVVFPYQLEEQKKIAEILTKVDEAIENTEQLIQKYEQVKVGLMQDLLTKGIDENGNIRSEETHQFKDSPLGRIPVEWDFGKFKSLCKYDITYGIVQAGPHIDNGVPYIKTGDLTGDNFKISNLQRTSAEIAKRFSRSKMELGEIVFALRGDIGNSKIITQEFVGSNLTQGTARISFNEDHLLNRFAIYMFQMPLIVKQIEESQKGTTFQEISLSTLRNFMINYPKDINEQEKIINALDRISKKIDLNKTLLKKIKLQKQGLMQDLLAGKVRVNY